MGAGNSFLFTWFDLIMFPQLTSLRNVFFPEAEAARKTALFGEMQDKKIQKSAFPGQPL